MALLNDVIQSPNLAKEVAAALKIRPAPMPKAATYWQAVLRGCSGAQQTRRGPHPATMVPLPAPLHFGKPYAPGRGWIYHAPP